MDYYWGRGIIFKVLFLNIYNIFLLDFWKYISLVITFKGLSSSLWKCHVLFSLAFSIKATDCSVVNLDISESNCITEALSKYTSITISLMATKVALTCILLFEHLLDLWIKIEKMLFLLLLSAICQNLGEYWRTFVQG